MTEPIRVLQVFAQMNRGGAETMIMNLYHNIDRTKVQFDFIVHTQDQCDFDDEIKSLGGRIYHIPRYSGKNHIQYKKAWIKFFEEHPYYKLIHGHVRSTASIYLKIAKKYGLTTIAHSHSTSSGKGISAIAKNILQYPIKNRADYLFACSKSAGEWLYGKKACKKENFIIVNNAIDTKKFIFNESTREEKRKELGIQDKFVIGHVGRFDTAKNQGFLIDIFKAVHDKNINSMLLLIGDGDLRKKIEDKVRELDSNNCVVFTGVRSDIADLMQVMDVFVFPSLYEGLPLTLIEAQAAGLPCIISDSISEDVKITELVEFLSIEEKTEIWSEKIIDFSDTITRKCTYENIIEAEYDIGLIVDKYQKFYISICNNTL